MTVGVDDAYSLFLNPAGIPGFDAEAISLGISLGHWTKPFLSRVFLFPDERIYHSHYMEPEALGLPISCRQPQAGAWSPALTIQV